MASACSIVMANDASMLGAASTGRPAIHTRASTCILVTLSLLCALVLVICGVLVVREWALSRTFDKTVCVVRNVTYAAKDQECSYCTSGAKDSRARMEKAAQIGDVNHPNVNLGGGSVCIPAFYPCVYVVVLYGVNNSRGARLTDNQAKLYENSVQATGNNRECSFFVCHKSREENAKIVDKFAQKWKSQTEAFRCFYDTRDPHRVIVHKKYSIVDVINCMLWPSVVIIVCIGVFLKLESKRRGLTFCGRVEEDELSKNKPDSKNAVVSKYPDKPIRCNHQPQARFAADTPLTTLAYSQARHRHHSRVSSLTGLNASSSDDVTRERVAKVTKGVKGKHVKGGYLKGAPGHKRDSQMTSSTPNIHNLKIEQVDIERIKKLARTHFVSNDSSGGSNDTHDYNHSNSYDNNNNNNSNNNHNNDDDDDDDYDNRDYEIDSTKNDDDSIHNNNKNNIKNNNKLPSASLIDNCQPFSIDQCSSDFINNNNDNNNSNNNNNNNKEFNHRSSCNPRGSLAGQRSMTIDMGGQEYKSKKNHHHHPSHHLFQSYTPPHHHHHHHRHQKQQNVTNDSNNQGREDYSNNTNKNDNLYNKNKNNNNNNKNGHKENNGDFMNSSLEAFKNIEVSNNNKNDKTKNNNNNHYSNYHNDNTNDSNNEDDESTQLLGSELIVRTTKSDDGEVIKNAKA